MSGGDVHTLEFLLAFDGRTHWLDQGDRLKFEIRKGEATAQRPHGLRYSLTLHDPDGRRLVGVDNAHSLPAVGSSSKERLTVADHWHRTHIDKGRPYDFIGAEMLLRDFFREVRRVLAERGVSDALTRVEERKTR